MDKKSIAMEYGPEIERAVASEVEDLNHSLVLLSRASAHPDDSYLFALIAQHKDRKDFTVWQYNTSGGLFWGHYNLSMKEALLHMAEILGKKGV